VHQKVSKSVDAQQSYNWLKSGKFLFDTTTCNKFEHFSLLRQCGNHFRCGGQFYTYRLPSSEEILNIS